MKMPLKESIMLITVLVCIYPGKYGSEKQK